MDFFEKPFTFDRVVRILITIGFFIGTIWVIDYLSDVLFPFFIALILAYMMNPFVNWLQRFVKSRIVAVLLGITIALGVLVGIFWIIIPMMGKEVQTLGQMMNRLVKEQNISQQVSTYLPPRLAEDVNRFLEDKDWQQLLNSEEVNKYLKMAWKKIAPHLGSIFSGTLSILFWIVGIFIVLLYLVFLLKDYNRVLDEWKDLIPPKYRKGVLDFLHNFERAMNTYFRAQAAIASTVGVLFAIGFTIIGLPLGIVLGLFIGLLNMVPYLQNIALLPAAFLALVKSLETGQNFWVVLAMTMSVFAIVQLIQDSILTPKIMGDATGMSPVIILLSLSVWGKILGMLGLLLAIPLTNLILTYYHTFISRSSQLEGPQKLPGKIDIPEPVAKRVVPF